MGNYRDPGRESTADERARAAVESLAAQGRAQRELAAGRAAERAARAATTARAVSPLRAAWRWYAGPPEGRERTLVRAFRPAAALARLVAPAALFLATVGAMVALSREDGPSLVEREGPAALLAAAALGAFGLVIAPVVAWWSRGVLREAEAWRESFPFRVEGFNTAFGDKSEGSLRVTLRFGEDGPRPDEATLRDALAAVAPTAVFESYKREQLVFQSEEFADGRAGARLAWFRTTLTRFVVPLAAGFDLRSVDVDAT